MLGSDIVPSWLLEFLGPPACSVAGAVVGSIVKEIADTYNELKKKGISINQVFAIILTPLWCIAAGVVGFVVYFLLDNSSNCVIYGIIVGFGWSYIIVHLRDFSTVLVSSIQQSGHAKNDQKSDSAQ